MRYSVIYPEEKRKKKNLLTSSFELRGENTTVRVTNVAPPFVAETPNHGARMVPVAQHHVMDVFQELRIGNVRGRDYG